MFFLLYSCDNLEIVDQLLLVLNNTLSFFFSPFVFSLISVIFIHVFNDFCFSLALAL